MQHKPPRKRRERYLSYAQEAEKLAAASSDAIAQRTYIKAAESWRYLATLGDTHASQASGRTRPRA